LKEKWTLTGLRRVRPGESREGAREEAGELLREKAVEVRGAAPCRRRMTAAAEELGKLREVN
jgi:hypothetical protein